MTDPNDTDTGGGVHRWRIDASDATSAAAHVEEKHPDQQRPRFVQVSRGFRVVSAVTLLDGAMVDDTSIGGSATVSPVPHGGLLVGLLAQGQMSVRTRSTDYRPIPGGMVCYPTGVPFELRLERSRGLSTSLTPEVVDRAAAALAGDEHGPVRFEELAPLSPALGRFCAGELVHVTRRVLPFDELLDHSIIRAETVDRIARAVLLAFANSALATATDHHRREANAAEPAAVRRAVEYIDGNAGKPLRVTDIAAAAGVGVRALQRAFVRHRGVSPLGYLRGVRLEYTHRDLRAADPGRGDTVAAVAARWGFSNPGRFADEYRGRFGRSPRETLHG